MSRISLVRSDDPSPELRTRHEELARHHTVTNMKAALLHSPEALRAVLEWYSLFDKVKPFLGERQAVLFCFAISRANSCELCTTFMRRAIIGWGENPEQLVLDEREQALWDYGHQLAKDANRVSDALYARLQALFTPSQIVDLTTFGALMIVNNVFNSALRIDVDESLDPYRIQPENYFA